MPKSPAKPPSDPAQFDLEQFTKDIAARATPEPSPNAVMSDDAAIPPQFIRPQPPASGGFPQAGPGTPMARYDGGRPTIATPPPAVVTRPHVDTALFDAAPHRYESRVNVLTAYRFDGRLAQAPPWVDRNWLAYDSSGDSPGVALNVSDPDGAAIGVAKVGDYVVVQDVVVDDPNSQSGKRKLPAQLGVMAAADFERLYRHAQSGGEK